eukprot:scaffold2132_cov99-Skeletonema_dohrnii-CCMP3373.AAC.1
MMNENAENNAGKAYVGRYPTSGPEKSVPSLSAFSTASSENLEEAASTPPSWNLSFSAHEYRYRYRQRQKPTTTKGRLME